MRIEIESHEFTSQANEKIEMTVSIGVVCDDGIVDDFRALVEKGDAALYKAKQNGRNRIINLESNR